MRYTILVAALPFCLLPGTLAGQLRRTQVDPSKVPAPQPHYLPEYTFDAPGDPLRWSKQRGGLMFRSPQLMSCT